jgi:hypothetical protein
MNIECITDVMSRGRLRWYGHVQRREDTAWIKRCIDMEMDGRRSTGRPKMAWMEVVKDMERCDLMTEDVSDRCGWRTKISVVR